MVSLWHRVPLRGGGALLLAALSLLSPCGCATQRTMRCDSVKPEEQLAREAGAQALFERGAQLSNSDEAQTNNAALDEALITLRHAFTLNPTNALVIASIVKNLVQRERYSQALEALEDFLATTTDEHDKRTMSFAAMECALSADRFDEAIRHGELLFSMTPESIEMAYALLRLYFDTGRTECALRFLAEHQQRFFDEGKGMLSAEWAVIRFREGHRDHTILECAKMGLALIDIPEIEAELMRVEAGCHLEAGHTNLAKNVLLEAYHRNPADCTSLMQLGMVWAQIPNATNHLARVVAEEPDNESTTLLTLAATHQALENNRKAIPLLREAARRLLVRGFFPSEHLCLWLCSLLEEDGEHSNETVTELERALIAHPDSHILQNFLAYLWSLQEKNLDQAMQLVNAALAQQPHNAAYLDTKGWILYKKGRYYDALQYLLKAAEGERESAEVLDHVGDALLAVGRKAEAIEFWRRSHEFEPQPAVAEKLRKHGGEGAKLESPPAGGAGIPARTQSPAHPA